MSQSHCNSITLSQTLYLMFPNSPQKFSWLKAPPITTENKLTDATWTSEEIVFLKPMLPFFCMRRTERGKDPYRVTNPQDFLVPGVRKVLDAGEQKQQRVCPVVEASRKGQLVYGDIGNGTTEARLCS